MEFCVLGLLIMRDMTIYEIHKVFEQSLSLFYSASLGSLKRAADLLLDGGFITCREESQGKRKKKVYSILPEGKKRFFGEMNIPIPASKLETVALSRISFFGLLTDEQKHQSLEVILAGIQDGLDSLQLVEKNLNGLEVPQSYSEIFHWQKKTLEYGILSHRAGLQWFEGLKGEISPPFLPEK